ncbi:MAG: UDP-2,3-diacylglucosamine hydrolase [Bacteroidetes bacterium RIFCSPLOWO2_02_FULL_36_8]|nr:MAG: UDP-2,3-diacylglucosamine hydrolase [Bacteroidetes bacterium RIFCSPLOWO2_02_FULL_36_8]OFY69081.1 MAG: UDP-2,3-diacylglucosamine hydrolase [Bacteroidetes bacterium RIFCSPLOWO2_12_FULL_37_12]
MTTSKKTYFASDFHLGMPNPEESLCREKKIVAWLENIKSTAGKLFLVGDVFDFWFEYEKVIPKGFIRLQGKLAELSDMGIEVYFFSGNHDVWIFDYFKKELNLKIYYQPLSLEISGKKFFVAHGDGIESHFSGYKIIKWIFHNRFCQRFFAFIHPDLGIYFANKWSRHSRKSSDRKGEKFYGEKEWAFEFAKKMETQQHHDFYVFGHRHFPADLQLNEHSRFINLGDWLNYFTYAVFDGEKMELRKFENGS